MSRRRVLGLLALVGTATACSARSIPVRGRPARSVSSWVAERRPQYLIAHRGSGDVYPEHSIEAYRAAVQNGAACLEVSVCTTSDNVLICMHDLTYDRTTTGTGVIRAQPSSVLADIGILQPQLGPAWTRAPLPQVPHLADVFAEFGRSVIYCLEAKDDAAYDAMMELAEQHGLRDNVIVKAYRTSPRIGQAQAAGYPVFVYLGPQDMTEDVIALTAGALRPTVDYLVLPATSGDDTTYYSADLIRAAVAHSVPTWVYPVHRRADIAYYTGLGVVGAVTSSYAYTAGLPPMSTDTWASKAIAAGQISRHPATDDAAATWTGVDELTLAASGAQQFVTMAQLAPVPAATGTYRISFSACFATLPSDPAAQLQIAFAHTDDSYYQHRWGRTNGYHAMLRVDGRLQLYRHDAGRPDGVHLGETATRPPAAGEWMSFHVDVSPDGIVWSRLGDGAARVASTDRSYRGGYFHLGRTATDGALALRQLSVQ